MGKIVVLVSCVKSKHPCISAASDLYTSALFRGMRRYAEQYADTWYTLSAKHGVLAPTDRVAPYEQTLNKMPKRERDCWTSLVSDQLLHLLPPATKVIVLAGQRYRADLVPQLEAQGFSVAIPMQGLKLGAQLKWLNEHTRCE
jgi:hypothetical protein